MFTLVSGEMVVMLSAEEVYNLCHDEKRLAVRIENERYIVSGKGYRVICPLPMTKMLWDSAGLPSRISRNWSY